MAVSERVQRVFDDINTLSVLEVSQLSKLMQEIWGVSAAAPVAVAAAPTAAAAAAPVEEKTEFNVVLEGSWPEQAERHQGGSRVDDPGPEGSQGPGRGRPEASQGSACRRKRPRPPSPSWKPLARPSI